MKVKGSDGSDGRDGVTGEPEILLTGTIINPFSISAHQQILLFGIVPSPLKILINCSRQKIPDAFSFHHHPAEEA